MERCLRVACLVLNLQLFSCGYAGFRRGVRVLSEDGILGGALLVRIGDFGSKRTTWCLRPPVEFKEVRAIVRLEIGNLEIIPCVHV